jgi:hypothetical protein
MRVPGTSVDAGRVDRVRLLSLLLFGVKMAPGTEKRLLVPALVAFLAWGHVTQTAFHWDCPVRALFHVPCPTCGMTGALRAMMHFDFAGALHISPLSFVVIPFVAVLAAVELGGYVVTARFGTWTNKSAVRIAGITMCAALFLVWIARFFGAFGGPVQV